MGFDTVNLHRPTVRVEPMPKVVPTVAAPLTASVAYEVVDEVVKEYAVADNRPVMLTPASDTVMMFATLEVPI